MSNVHFLKGMSKGITKITDMSYPKGTMVRNTEHFGRDFMSREVVKSKNVYLPEQNPLFKAGIRGFCRQELKDGDVVMHAIKHNDDIVAFGLEPIKNLIKSIKDYGLKLQ